MTSVKSNTVIYSCLPIAVLFLETECACAQNLYKGCQIIQSIQRLKQPQPPPPDSVDDSIAIRVMQLFSPLVL